MKRDRWSKFGVMVVIFFICFVFLSAVFHTHSAWAKYCPNCGTYNQDSNAFCTKCGADLRTSEFGNKPRVGVLFVASVYPYHDARFTIYHKGNITPFIIWNSEGKYEIGEVQLPVLTDMEFVPVLENQVPSRTSVPYIAKRYNISKLMVLNMNAQKVERVPLFSSQRYDVNLDIITYICPAGDVIQEKRYKQSLNSWPDITVNQVKETCQGCWQQFIPNIHALLR